MRVVKFCLIAALVAMLGGCAAYNYPKYAEQQKEAYTAQTAYKLALIQALGSAAASTDDRTRDSAMMALLVMGLTDKPMRIEAPREGALEQGLRTMFAAVPMLGQAYVLARELGTNAGTHTYTQNVSGTGNSGLLNTGIGNFTLNPATAPPTVVTQPEPVIVPSPDPIIINPGD